MVLTELFEIYFFCRKFDFLYFQDLSFLGEPWLSEILKLITVHKIGNLLQRERRAEKFGKKEKKRKERRAEKLTWFVSVLNGDL